MNDPPIRALFVAANNPAVTCPDVGGGAPRARARGPLHRGPRPVPVGHRALRRHRAAGGDVLRERGRRARVRHVLHAVHSRGGAAAGRGVVESAARAGAGAAPRARRTRCSPWTPTSSSAPSSATPRGPAAAVDPATLRTAGPIKLAIRRGGRGPAFGDAVGQARVLLGDARPPRACPRCPTGCPIPRARRGRALAAAPPHRAGLLPGHTASAGVAALRKTAGPPECVLHPGRRGGARPRATATPVELFNDRGAVTFVLRVSDETLAGRGLRARASGRSGEAIAGTINMLCSTATATWARARRTRARASTSARWQRRRRGAAPAAAAR